MEEPRQSILQVPLVTFLWMLQGPESCTNTDQPKEGKDQVAGRLVVGLSSIDPACETEGSEWDRNEEIQIVIP